MKNWWNAFYKENKAIVWAAVIGIILSLGVLWKVKDEVTRFTLVMPIFAGFILFSILVTADEDLEDEKKDENKSKETKIEEKSKKFSKKKSSKK
jgi:hypothetical protein